jgi:hypothetical protein
LSFFFIQEVKQRTFLLRVCYAASAATSVNEILSMVVLQEIILRTGVVVSEKRRDNRVIVMNGLRKVAPHVSKSEMKQNERQKSNMPDSTLSASPRKSKPHAFS